LGNSLYRCPDDEEDWFHNIYDENAKKHGDSRDKGMTDSSAKQNRKMHWKPKDIIRQFNKCRRHPKECREICEKI